MGPMLKQKNKGGDPMADKLRLTALARSSG
jgi:hypothetical protein